MGHGDRLSSGDDNKVGIGQRLSIDGKFDAGERGRLSVLANFERRSGEMAIEDGAVLKNLDVLATGVGNGCSDLDISD
jgi:hypothetical protein